jgi:PAS domain-containing protein
MLNFISENLEVLLTFVGGVLLPLIWRIIKEAATGKNRAKKELIAGLLEQNENLRKKYTLLQDERINVQVDYQEKLNRIELNSSAKIHELQRKLDNFRNQVFLLESAQADIPIPMWLTDSNTFILWVNESYIKTILEPMGLQKNSVLGKSMEELVNLGGFSDLETYIANNKKVLQTGEVVYGVELAFVNDEEKRYIVVKYPRKVGGSIIGITGLALDADKIKDLLQNIS